ncbi:MAG TPA: TonB family protein [Candidatus Binataceae bacterium]|nr:TonB family protein [Candidatus Binataceae bacterium]HTZ82347.1 TonB family protein [Candidatus Acidoferrales bacterium]
MGYQALLFCPDDKTARTVTQVLSELEFTVEACIEPFAAVKKLMGQHFDAVVVDCDNEQNATLLFKSARNSASNQTSLAVAVVEGQAGVAKAFRIGANLVLTKPINIEQAKGTLRVARGLLRKSEPAKPVAPAAAPVPEPPQPKPAPLKPILAAKPPGPSTLPPVPVRAVEPPKPPAPAWPVAAASSAPSAKDDDPLDISFDEPAAAALKAPEAVVRAPQSFPSPEPAAPAVEKPTFAASSPISMGGAASAPAPARKAPDAAVEKAAEHAAETIAEKAVSVPSGEATGIVGSAPSFTFGGANVESESSGGSKKILIGAVAAIVVAAAGYFGYTQYESHQNQTAATQVAPAAAASQTAKPSSRQAEPAPVQSAPVPAPAASAPVSEQPSDTVDDADSSAKEIKLHSAPATKSEPATHAVDKPATADKPAETPLVVKGGKEPAIHAKAAQEDAQAPSIAGIAAPGSSAPPLNFVPAADASVKPLLQKLNISQGVSQGLILKKVSPSYPASAIRLRIEGTVELLATISKDGSITHIKVLSGNQQLTRAAVDAVKQWKYRPYLLNGEPVEIETQVTVNFKLPQ